MGSTTRPQPSSSLLDEIVQVQKGSKKSKCTFAPILEAMTEEDREALENALGNPLIKSTHIAKALEGRGFDIGAYTLQRHRRGACSCG